MPQRVIILVGGPMDGIAHELQKGFPAPDRMGLPHPDDTNEPGKQDLHWYRVEGNKAYFERTEKQ